MRKVEKAIYYLTLTEIGFKLKGFWVKEPEEAKDHRIKPTKPDRPKRRKDPTTPRPKNA